MGNKRRRSRPVPIGLKKKLRKSEVEIKVISIYNLRMVLGIDLGEKTTGLATSDSSLSTPYKTITHKNTNQALKMIVKIIEEENVDTVVIGFVEGKIKKLFENFAQKLKEAKPELNIVLWDETLTSRQATENMVNMQISKGRRAKKQHEVAASIILQSYLDEQNTT